MPVSAVKATLPYDTQRVWDIVTSVRDCGRSSDLDRTEIKSEEVFVEYTKDGFATTFTVTVCEPLKRWEFDMENINMTGHWTGVFTHKDGQTEIEFTENVTAKKWFMKPFVKGFLKKQQEQYLNDLKTALRG